MNIEVDGNAPLGENQYQLAMSEALLRHEADLVRVQQLKKLQERDFKEQIKMQDDIVKAEREQEEFKKVQLHQELT